MRAHIVLAHPEPRSFNGHLARVAADTLSARGWGVIDLVMSPPMRVRSSTPPISSSVPWVPAASRTGFRSGIPARSVFRIGASSGTLRAYPAPAFRADR